MQVISINVTVLVELELMYVLVQLTKVMLLLGYT